MTEIAQGDWDALQNLIGRVGLPTEQVALLRRRLEDGRTRPGSPYTLLVGRPDAGIDLLLDRWLAPEVTDALRQAGGRPLVVGPSPKDVQPRLGTWPTWKSSKPPDGHLIVLRTARRQSADVTAQLASLGLIEQVVLVCRLFQAMHGAEREMVEALAPLAATARVLLVWQPGEQPSAADLAEVPASAVRQLRQHGFEAGRCLGAGIWFAGQPAPRPDMIVTPAEFLQVDANAVPAGHAGMVRQALTQLLREVYRQAATRAGNPHDLRPIPPEEQERLVRELGGYLTRLGREVDRMASARRGIDAEYVRGYVMDAIRGWGAYTGMEGHWMKYVETLRPGMQAALVAEAQAMVAVLDYQRGSASKLDEAPTGPVDRLLVEAKRLAIGLACGLGAYGLATMTLTLPVVVDTLVKIAVLGLGGILGYGLGCSLFRASAAPAAKPVEVAAEPSSLQGWAQFERRLTSWFVDKIHARLTTPADECRALSSRLGIIEEIRA